MHQYLPPAIVRREKNFANKISTYIQIHMSWRPLHRRDLGLNIKNSSFIVYFFCPDFKTAYFNKSLFVCFFKEFLFFFCNICSFLKVKFILLSGFKISNGKFQSKKSLYIYSRLAQFSLPTFNKCLHH